jgi:hypothetical protein
LSRLQRISYLAIAQDVEVTVLLQSLANCRGCECGTATMNNYFLSMP